MTLEEHVRQAKLLHERLAETFYFVEATDFERLCLWREENFKGIAAKEPARWEQTGPGLEVELPPDGTGLRRYLQLSWDRIGGKLVCFYDTASSCYVDRQLTREWVLEHGKGFDCNAMNFHHCLHAIERGT